MYISTKTRKDKIEDTLKENVPDDLKKKFLERAALGLGQAFSTLTTAVSQNFFSALGF